MGSGVSQIFHHPLFLALLGGTTAWGLTCVGASLALLFKQVGSKLLDAILGFAAGVMLAASFFSLLSPSIELARELRLPTWLPATVGFLLGAGFLRLLDFVLPHLHPQPSQGEAEGIPTNWKASTLLVIAITIHNIPEGLSIGVGFGAYGLDPTLFSLASAWALATGIGLQDIPEGFAVSMPLRKAGLSPLSSFGVGVLSGLVEPIFALIGAYLAAVSRYILPYGLGFAAGAMIYVAAEELIPEVHRSGHSDIATMGLIIGFAVMMVLDVALS